MINQIRKIGDRQHRNKKKTIIIILKEIKKKKKWYHIVRQVYRIEEMN